MYLTGVSDERVSLGRVPHGCAPHGRALYGRVYVSKSKKALEKPPDPPPYKRWSTYRDLTLWKTSFGAKALFGSNGTPTV
jgi:hypothetical protein